MARGKILVIRGGAIGDFVLTLPVLAALRERFPETHLEVLGYPHIAQLALAGGLADAVRSIEARALAGFFARAGSLDEGLQEYFAGFALVISFLYDPDRIFRENVARCSKAQFISGPHHPAEGEHLHATEVFLQPLQRLAIYEADPVPRLDLPASPSFPLPKGTWLAIHPGSGSERKNWPEAQWTALLSRLAPSSPANLLLVGGEAEGDRLRRLSSLWPSDRVQLAQSLPLATVAGCLRQCHAYLGHDSGISHLAAAVGLRGLILWGDSHLEVWRPLSPLVKVIRPAEGLAGLSASRVMDELRQLAPELFGAG
ncbi:MAG: glycosyltransferase family 9 protein [Chloroflexi bacterium]|nr:glycosyltransferase family 9 protein [Chloroflexota bacterium]